MSAPKTAGEAAYLASEESKPGSWDEAYPWERADYERMAAAAVAFCANQPTEPPMVGGVAMRGEDRR